MKDRSDMLKKYAALAVRVGINLEEKEGLVITTGPDGLPLARLAAEEAYSMGAKNVELIINDDKVTLSRYINGKEAAFEEFPSWKTAMFEGMYKDNYHHLFIISPDPELLKVADPEKVGAYQKVSSAAMAPVMRYRMTGVTKWAIVAVPSVPWAESVFPDLKGDEAVDALWDEIIKASRLDLEDPVEAWREHDADLKKRMEYLNGMNFEKLNFKGPGTDLEVYLASDHWWIGGSSDSSKGVPYMANMPTEEVFTAPHKLKVNGTLKSTKPLSYNGKIVEDFGFTFKDGAVTDFYAAKGGEVLEALLKNDDGARYLGEVALVQDDSPISNTGILFNNTLFDENASVHFALGRAYGYSIRNGSTMTQDELAEKGANYSLIHVDFMVGGPSLFITATDHEGNTMDIFRNGNWVI